MNHFYTKGCDLRVSSNIFGQINFHIQVYIKRVRQSEWLKSLISLDGFLYRPVVYS